MKVLYLKRPEPLAFLVILIVDVVGHYCNVALLQEAVVAHIIVARVLHGVACHHIEFLALLRLFHIEDSHILEVYAPLAVDVRIEGLVLFLPVYLSQSGHLYALYFFQRSLGEIDVVVHAFPAGVLLHNLAEDTGEERLDGAEVPFRAEIVQGNAYPHNAVHRGLLCCAQGAGVQRCGGCV